MTNKNLNMQHERILFLISLPETEKFLAYRESVLECITILRAKGVDVRESIHHEDLADINQYGIVIIVAHHNIDENALLLSDGKLYMDDFLNSLPEDFNGVIDFSSCYSEKIKNAIKKRCPHCHPPQVSKDKTDLRVRLVAYPYVIDQLHENKDLDYHNTYMKVLDMLEEAAEGNPAYDEYEDESIKLGEESSEDVKTSVFFPERVVRGEFYKLQIFLHLDVETGTLYFDIARENDPETTKRKTNVALKNIQKGDHFLLNLSFLDGENRRPTEQIIVDERDELTFENDYYTKEIIVNDEDKTEIIICVKVTKEYHCNKFFTLLKFIKDCEVSSLEFDTYIKTKDIQYSSAEKDEEEKKKHNSIVLGQSWMTRKAERVFVGAFDNQWIEQTENGFKWIGFGKTKENGLVISRTRKLAYLCHKIFGDNVPWEDIETFFGERKLSRDWGNIDGNKREHQPWMYKIDHLIDNEEKKMKLNETP